MTRTTLIFIFAVTALTATAQEQIESIVICDHDSAYYAEQTQLWREEVKKRPDDGSAWKNLYQAALYQEFYVSTPDFTTAQQILNEMEKAIPQDYYYYWCKYRQSAGGEESYQYAEEALKKFPEKPSFFDYDMMTSYLLMRYDESRLSDLCRHYYESGIYSPSVLQYSYNELQGMDEGGIYIGNGDACIIPKILLQYGKGVHQDKIVVCMPFLAVTEYREKLLQRLGIDSSTFQYERPTTQEAYDRQERELINLIISHTKRPVYFSTYNGMERNAPWEKQLYNEGLTLRYSPTKYDNFRVKRRNVEERYLMEYLIERFAPDNWITADRFSANYSVLLADLLKYYRKNDQQRHQWLMRLLVSGIDRTNLTEEQKENYRKLLE